MLSESDSSDVPYIDSDEREEEDDDGDLSHLGAAATSVKFQTVKQQSFQRTERGTERLAQQILGTCRSSESEIVATPGVQQIEREHPTDCGTKVLQQNFIQVQQQFGDVTVQGTRNLTIGGTQNICKPVQEEQKPLTWTDKILNRTASRIKQWTKGMVQTSALEEVMKKLNAGSEWVTIKGSPGEGKTTVGYMALEELQRMGRQVFQVRTPQEFSEVTATCSRPVIMLDDILGNLEFDHVEWSRWKPVLRGILDMSDHRSLEEVETSEKDLTVILVGRDYVLKTASCDMGRMSDYFTRKAHVVFMSHTQKRTIKEKMSIVMAISESSGMKLDKRTIDQICHSSCPHGFPHVCRLFLTVWKHNSKITVKSFFKTPLEFLNQTIASFTRDKLKLHLFKEMIKGNGKVSVRYLGKQENSSDTISIAYDLVGSYLRKEDDYFVFDHPSIYDSVAYNLVELYPLFIIENCNMSFIRERLRVMPSDDTQHSASNERSNLFVRIPQSYTEDLSKRFADEISDRNFFQVLSHRAFSDELFTKDVMSQLTVPLTKLVKLTDRHTDECFFSLLTSSKSSHLLKYIDRQTDVQRTPEEFKSILHGICKYAASDALTYLKQTHGTIDINVNYGEQKQSPLMISAETRDSQFVHKIISLNPNLSSCDNDGKSVLHYLCENGLVSAVKQVINSGTSIHVTDRRGWSPLYYACRSSYIDVIDLLLKNGVMIDCETVTEACRLGNMDIVRLLFERGAKVDMASGLSTHLHLAAYNDHVKLITFLLEKGAFVNSTSDALKRSPLHVACRFDKAQAVKCLLEHGADVNCEDSRQYHPLHTAAEVGAASCVEMLLKADANPCIPTKFTEYTPLHAAVNSKSKQCVDLLLKAGANVNAQSKLQYLPLAVAAQKGLLDIVDMLLKAGALVNVHDPKQHTNCTPLIGAAKGGSKYCIDVFLKAGAEVNAYDRHGETALNAAAASGFTECVHTLLKAGADANFSLEGVDTPLHGAAASGSKKCVDALLKAKARVNVQNREGLTPLYNAAHRGCAACVTALLNAGADANLSPDGVDTPLHRAAEKGSRECVDVLLKAGAHLWGKSGCTPLHAAAKSRSKECVHALLQTGISVNVLDSNGHTPLHTAVEMKSKEGAEVLLKAGADLNLQDKMGYTPLHMAVERHCPEFVDTLVIAGADVNKLDKNGYTAFHRAVEIKQNKCGDLLLKSGTDVNLQKKNGNTPLHTAVEKENKECLDGLLKASADINVLNSYGYTALHIAVEKQLGKIVDMLLKAGAEVNVRSTYGLTPLHISVENQFNGTFDQLLNSGADVNLQSRDGLTPLHISVENQFKEIFEKLLNSGADVNLQSRDGITPLYLASDKGNREYIDGLLQAGADLNVQGKDGYALLYEVREFTEYMDVLLKVGVDVNIQSKDGSAALHRAAGTGFKEKVDMLLNAGADVNIQDKDKQTPLHTAMYYRINRSPSHLRVPDITVCRALVKQGALVNWQDIEGNTPLHQLCCVDSDNKVYKDRLFVCASSYKDEYIALVTLLTDHGADVNIQNSKGKSALHGWCQTMMRLCSDHAKGVLTDKQNVNRDEPEALDSSQPQGTSGAHVLQGDVNIDNIRGELELLDSSHTQRTLAEKLIQREDVNTDRNRGQPELLDSSQRPETSDEHVIQRRHVNTQNDRMESSQRFATLEEHDINTGDVNVQNNKGDSSQTQWTVKPQNSLKPELHDSNQPNVK